MLLLYILYLVQLVYAFIYCIIYFYSYTYFLSIFKGLFFLFVNNYSNRGLILNSIWKLGCKQFFFEWKTCFEHIEILTISFKMNFTTSTICEQVITKKLVQAS